MAVDKLTRRLGVFAEIASSSKSRFGRTALMKLCYFLQVVKGVPLDYDFSLYSYGPFDSQVLSDLGTAETVGVLKSDLEYYPGGYGYLIGESGGAPEARDSASEFIDQYRDQINWAVTKLSYRKASELELLSTIVYVKQAIDGKISKRELIASVKAVKPHFSESQIETQIDWLSTECVISGV